MKTPIFNLDRKGVLLYDCLLSVGEWIVRMLWNDAELQNLSGLGKEIVVERYMKNLAARENDDLFQKENFPYLWGLIGVAGVKGTSSFVRHKIWDALVRFGVIDAFDRGLLSDYNRKLAEHFNDGRLKAWKGLDNFQASVKFRKTVLDKLVKTDADLAQKVSPYCVDYKKMMEQLDESELNDKLKAYLERFRGLGAACGVTTDAVAAVYEKTDVLRKLCDVAAYTHRKLTEKEKDYLFSYLYDAVNDGFSPKSIGLDDAVLAKLMADEALDGLSELEAEPLLARNAEIEDFAAKFEEEFGFYEETEAKFIKHEFGKIRPITERCLKCIQKNAEPKGVVFAMMLVELNQIKSAVQILLELAKKGKATELIGFLHRLLPKVKGSESFILDIICINLQNFHGEDDYFVEYTARRTLTAVRTFIEANCPQQAAMLLKHLVLGNWFLDKTELVKQFILLANTLMILDDTLTPEMSFLAQQLKLRIFETENGVIIGTDEDNPLAMTQQKVEQFVAGTTMLSWAKYAEENKKRMQATVEQAIEGDSCDIDFGMPAKSRAKSYNYKIPSVDGQPVQAPWEEKSEANLPKVQKTLQQKIYNRPEDIVIPQKIQDKTPELTTQNVVKPTGKIPSSADILRNYVPQDIAQEVVSELPSMQIWEKSAELASEEENEEVSEHTEQINVSQEATTTEALDLSLSHASDETLQATEMVHSEPVKEETLPILPDVQETRYNSSVEMVPETISAPSQGISTTERAHEVDEIDVSQPIIAELNIPAEASGANIVANGVMEDTVNSEPSSEDWIQPHDVEQVSTELVTEVNPVVESVATTEVQEENVSAIDTQNVAQDNSSDEQTTFAPSDTVPTEQSNDTVEAVLPEVAEAQAAVQNLDELPKFEEWENTEEEENLPRKKININSILNINSKEVDKHFEHIKQIAATAMKRAEEQAAAIKKKVEDSDLANSPSISKFKSFAQKIKMFRKK